MVDSVSSGDVAVAVGMPHASTGDTLIALDGSSSGLQLDGVTIPPPVFSLAVEAESASQQARNEKKGVYFGGCGGAMIRGRNAAGSVSVEASASVLHSQ